MDAAATMRTLTGTWRRWRQRARAQAELAGLHGEKDSLARDLDLSSADLSRLSAMPAGSAALLDVRMVSLGLSAASVAQSDPAVMRDLQRTCSFCSLKSQCGRDLASERRARDVATYCPNEQTLNALRRP